MLVLCCVSSLGISTQTPSGHIRHSAQTPLLPELLTRPPLPAILISFPQPLRPKPSASRLAPFSQPIYNASAHPFGSTFWIPPESHHFSGAPLLPCWPPLSPGPLLTLLPQLPVFSLAHTVCCPHRSQREPIKTRWDRVTRTLPSPKGPQHHLPCPCSSLASSAATPLFLDQTHFCLRTFAPALPLLTRFPQPPPHAYVTSSQDDTFSGRPSSSPCLKLQCPCRSHPTHYFLQHACRHI